MFLYQKGSHNHISKSQILVMACTRTPASQFGFPEHDIVDLLKIGQSHNDEENSLSINKKKIHINLW